MMEKDQLRKADIFSGSLVLILGLFIIGQAVQMPMKDSWGGVQNVWFVSPALFPLFVGTMLAFLGLVLINIAIKSCGAKGIAEVFAFLGGGELRSYLQQPKTIRFYGVVFNLMVFVFVMIPRIDFFPASIFFLLVLFFMYYLGDHGELVKIFKLSLLTGAVLMVFLYSGMEARASALLPFSGDYLVFAFIAALCLKAAAFIKNEPQRRKKYRLCLLVGFLAPVVIGVIFKYFLLVPMPFEGMVVGLLDTIWYAEIWS